MSTKNENILYSPFVSAGDNKAYESYESYINGGSPVPPSASVPVTPPPYVYTPGSSAPTNGSAMDYATWLQGHTKYQAEQTRDKALTNIERERQRQIVDANTTHRLSQVTYGANAEKMASMGLTGSGYGEYLTGKAYATQRGEIQGANALASQRRDEVLYQEGQTKLAADIKYAEDLIGIQNQQNTDYTSIYDAAINGASIESIIQDGRWSTLTPEQQTTIRQVTTANSLMSRINAGESLESIKSGAEWNTLTLDQQTRLESLYNTKTETDTTAIEANYSTWLNAISTGEATLEQVKALSGYEKLTPEMKAALEKAESEYNTNKLNEEKEANLAEFESNFATWLTNIKRGAITLDELKNLDAYKKMAADPNGATFITQLETAQANYNANKVDEENEANSAAIETNFEKWLNDINVGSLTLSDIQNLSDFKALETARPDLLKLLQEAQDNTNKSNANEAMPDVLEGIAGGATIDEIEENLEGSYNEDTVDLIVENAKETVKKNIEKYISNPEYDADGNINTSILDDAYKSGSLSKKEYQSYYKKLIFNDISSESEISVEDAIKLSKSYDTLVREQKLSYKDGDSLKQEVYNKVGKSVEGADKREGKKYIRNLEYNGTSYVLELNTKEPVTNDISLILSTIAKNSSGGIKDGSRVMVGKTGYVVVAEDGTWYPYKATLESAYKNRGVSSTVLYGK